MKWVVMIIFFNFYMYAADKAIIISGPYFGSLPIEVTSKIIKNVLRLTIGKDIDDNKKEQYIQVPLFLGVTFSQELCDCLQKLPRLKIIDRQFSIEEILSLPPEKRKVLCGLANRFNSLLFGDIEEADFQVLIANRTQEKDALTGLKLEVNPLGCRMRFVEGTTNFVMLTTNIMIFISMFYSLFNDGNIEIRPILAFLGFAMTLKSFLAITNWSNPKYWARDRRYPTHVL